jgi:hypothetical protein
VCVKPSDMRERLAYLHIHRHILTGFWNPERRHEETNNFHLPVRKMVVTLDDDMFFTHPYRSKNDGSQGQNR